MTARTIVARHASSPSSPAPAAHRCAAAGLDGDTHGQVVCIGAVNDAVGSSLRSTMSVAVWAVPVVCQEAKELAASRVEGALLDFGLAMGEQWPAIVVDEVEDDLLDGPPAEATIHLQLADHLTAESPDIVAVPVQGLARHKEGQQLAQERLEAFDHP